MLFFPLPFFNSIFIINFVGGYHMCLCFSYNEKTDYLKEYIEWKKIFPHPFVQLRRTAELNLNSKKNYYSCNVCCLHLRS